MFSLNYEIDFLLVQEAEVLDWLKNLILQEDKKLGDIAYIFCSDAYLLEKNVKYLKHNTLTDIISFDYSLGNLLAGDIFISVDRVRENAIIFETSFTSELHRVMAHGILHYCGYKDKSEEDKRLMRSKEDYYLSLRTFN